MFIVYYEERMNHTDASKTCENQNGYLALVLSDIRTNSLSLLVADHTNDINKNTAIFQHEGNTSDTRTPEIPIHHAFVGLREVRIKGQFLDSNSVPIVCFRFRAWEPKYP